MKPTNNLPQNIGFVGLGAMGLPLATHLVSAGYTVNGLDMSLEQQQLAEQAGINVISDLRHVCELSEVIVVCLPHPTISREVVLGKNGIVTHQHKVKIVIETSTLLPTDVVNFSQQLAGKNIDFLSAPMFGGQSSAENGQLWFVVEGEKNIFDRYKEIFYLMGKKVNYIGKAPQATIAKLARNLCRFANVATAIEVIKFVRHYSNDIQPIYELLAEDSLTNFDHVWDKTLRNYALDNQKYYTSQISIKDLQIALNMATEKGIELPIAAITKKLHEEMQKPTTH